MAGFISQRSVTTTLQGHRGKLVACYRDARRQKPGLEGEMVVRFKIDGTGQAQASAIEESAIGHPGMEACVAKAINALRFPEPDGGIAVVSVPLVFE